MRTFHVTAWLTLPHGAVTRQHDCPPFLLQAPTHEQAATAARNIVDGPGYAYIVRVSLQDMTTCTYHNHAFARDRHGNRLGEPYLLA